jgi:hypothetical protein
MNIIQFPKRINAKEQVDKSILIEFDNYLASLLDTDYETYKPLLSKIIDTWGDILDKHQCALIDPTKDNNLA